MKGLLRMINKLMKRTKIYAIHPETKKSIEIAFTIGGHDYYKFKNIKDMPTARYITASQFQTESECKVTFDDLKKDINAMISLQGKGMHQEVSAMLYALGARTDLSFEHETMFLLASAVYFTLEEDVTEYDFDYNKQKIENFKTEGLHGFFLLQPAKSYLLSLNISDEDLMMSLALEREKLEAINRVRESILKEELKTHTSEETKQ